MAEVHIRQATADDCHDIVTLIKELAVYEKLEDRVSITEETLRNDGFGDAPFYKCKLAIATHQGKEQTVAYALYFPIYSTFEGRAFYLEDIYVKPDFRGRGIGTDLWRKIAKESLDNGCSRLDFQVLRWNKKAIALYESHGAKNITELDQWNVFRMDRSALANFTANTN